MHILETLRRQVATLAAAAAIASVPGAALRAEPAPGGDHVVRVTADEVAASNEKVKAVYADLAAMWTADFRRIGERFDTPRLARYRRPVATPCGVMQPHNAGYCPLDNTIYYDDVFVTAQSKIVGQELHTDGDMAAVGIIAHEVGHAVAIQLGHESRKTYDNESTADCLAGAFAQHAGATGALESGDIDEAFFGMASAGDPSPTLTGNGRIDRRILARAAAMGHGTREQRVSNFRDGYERGAGACLSEFGQT